MGTPGRRDRRPSASAGQLSVNGLPARLRSDARPADNFLGMSTEFLAAQQDLWELFQISAEPGQDGLGSYLERVCEFCERWFEADGVTLFVRDFEEDLFRLRAQSGADRKVPISASFRLGEGFAGLAASDGNPILLSHGDPLAVMVSGLNGTKKVVGSAIVVPLITPLGECVGVLNLSRRLKGTRFSRSDTSRAVAISQHLALAVSNAALVSRLQEAADKHQALAATTANIVESLQAAVVSIDKEDRVAEANRQALRLLGKSRSNVSGENWTDLFKGFSPAAARKLDACVKRARSGKVRRVRISEKPDKHYQICASPTSGGEVTLVIEDVSASVRRDRQLERSLRLAEIGQMTAAVAHEIRNPLTSIKGAAQMISDESCLTEAQKWGMVIAEEAESLNSLCNDFLELARPINLNPKPTDLIDLVQGLLNRLGPEFRSVGVEANLVAVSKPPIIMVDPARILQALRNLLANAVQAMPSGGKVTVRIQERQREVEILVEDAGIGMTPSQLRQVFTPFFTTKAQGTGLGLCNVRRIVEAHDGLVRVESKRGKGTKLFLRLPVGKRP